LHSVPAWFVVTVTTAAQMVVAMSNIVLPTIAPKVAESLGVDPVDRNGEIETVALGACRSDDDRSRCVLLGERRASQGACARHERDQA